MENTLLHLYLHVFDQELQEVPLLQGWEVFDLEVFCQLLLQSSDVCQSDG